jgi:hypothetical protein
VGAAHENGCLVEDKDITFRASYLIDPKGVRRQITMNDLPVGRSVDEALRLVPALVQLVASGVGRFLRVGSSSREWSRPFMWVEALTSCGADEG